MKIGFVHDAHPLQRPGGAQYQVDDLIAACPEEHSAVWCLPGQWERDCDLYVVCGVTNVRQEDVDWLDASEKPRIRLVPAWDTGGWRRDVRHLNDPALFTVFRSPLHAEVYQQMFGDEHDPRVIPPPVAVDEIRLAIDGVPRNRDVCWIGEYFAHKGYDYVRRWAAEEAPDRHVDYYGINLTTPEQGKGFTLYGQLPDRPSVWRTMAAHRAFAHYPRFPDPFAVTVIEAWMAGCDLILAGRIGARSYGEEWNVVANRCKTAAADFWTQVLEVAA